MDRWVFKGKIVSLDIEGAKVTCALDLGFGRDEVVDLRLYGIQAPLPPHRARAAADWLKANKGQFVAVEVTKVDGEYFADVEGMSAPMRGISLNLQIELASSLVV